MADLPLIQLVAIAETSVLSSQPVSKLLRYNSSSIKVSIFLSVNFFESLYLPLLVQIILQMLNLQIQTPQYFLKEKVVVLTMVIVEALFFLSFSNNDKSLSW